MTVRRALLAVVSALLLAPVIYLLAYFSIEIYPQLEEIDAMLVAEPEHTSPPPGLYQLALRAETKQGILNYVSKALAHRSAGERESVGAWQLRMMRWYFAVSALYSEHEQFVLWLELAPFERGRGLNAASLYFFGKPLSRLTEEELAALVAMVRSPSVFRPGSERSKERVRFLLSQPRSS